MEWGVPGRIYQDSEVRAGLEPFSDPDREALDIMKFPNLLLAKTGEWGYVFLEILAGHKVDQH